jgi:hypothetical protein
MSAKAAERPVVLRSDAGQHTINLTVDDFRALKSFAGGRMEVKHAQKEFKRLGSLGLVKHRFDYDNGWPIARAELTKFGEQALAQEFGQ